MYQDYFGFVEMPFHTTPNPRFLFLSPTHEDALQHLRDGIEEKKGFIVNGTDLSKSIATGIQ
jgi:general secretion pathway protein A